MKVNRKLLFFVGLGALVGIAPIVYAAYRIEQHSASILDLKSLPHKRVGLVLGCSPVLSSGAPNLFFKNRITAAALLFTSKKVDYLLLSGDNHTPTYNEPAAMKSELLHLGIPEDRIILDHAGLSTFDSIVRAKEVFGLSDLCIITQRDHALRAIYIATKNGMEVVAYAAQDVSIFNGARTKIRESLARIRAILDVNVFARKPRYLGPPIQIGEKVETRR